MSELNDSLNSAGTCALCGRLVVPGQKVCTCGAIYVEPTEQNGPEHTLRFLLPVIPALGFMYLLYRIFQPGPLMFSVMPLVKVWAINAIACAAVALFVADRAFKSEAPITPGPLSALSPVSWFAAIVLLWPVTFPMFMKTYTRPTQPEKYRLGLAISLLFLLAFLYAGFVTRGQQPVISSAPQTKASEPPPPESRSTASPPSQGAAAPGASQAPAQTAPASAVVPASPATPAPGNANPSQPPVQPALAGQPAQPAQPAHPAADSRVVETLKNAPEVGVEILKRR